MHRVSQGVFIALCFVLALGYLGHTVALYQCERTFFAPHGAWHTLRFIEDFTLLGYLTLAVVNVGLPGLLGWVGARKINPWGHNAGVAGHILGVLALISATGCVYVQFFARYQGFMSSLDRTLQFYFFGAFALGFILVAFLVSGGRQHWAVSALAVFGVGALDRL